MSWHDNLQSLKKDLCELAISGRIQLPDDRFEQKVSSRLLVLFILPFFESLLCKTPVSFQKVFVVTSVNLKIFTYLRTKVVYYSCLEEIAHTRSKNYGKSFVNVGWINSRSKYTQVLNYQRNKNIAKN